VLTTTCSFDFIAILCGGPYSAVTQLRDNPTSKSSFLEVHLAQGVTFWVPTRAPQPLVTRPGSVSTCLSYLAHGSPPGVALSWVVSVPGVSQRWRGYFTSQVTPHWYWEYGLEATFLFSLLLFWGTETSRGVAPSTVFPTHGYRGVTSSTWRRLTLAMPTPSDAYTWRRLKRSTCWLSSLGSLDGSHHLFDFDFDFGQRPGTGQYR